MVDSCLAEPGSLAATGQEYIQWEMRSDTAVFHPLPTAKKSYYHKHSNYWDCLHSATVYWGEIQWPAVYLVSSVIIYANSF